MRRKTSIAAGLTLALAGTALAGAEPVGRPGRTAEPALFGAGPQAFVTGSAARPAVVGVYVPGWESPVLLERLAPGSATHLLYAFLRLCGPGQLSKDSAGCAGRAAFEIAADPAQAVFDAGFQQLKRREPQLQVLASVGGWGGSDPFFHLAADPARRAVFVASAVRFLAEHPGFDGIDIDWEHPGGNGAANGVALGSPDDGRHYATLMQELRAALDAEGRRAGRRYLLTAAVNATRAIIDRIDFRAAVPALDLVFMMSYDYYGGWSPTIGHHTTLRPSSAQADDGLSRAVENFRRAGVPPAKLVAGVAMYGRGFAGVTLARHGAPHGGVFPGGDGSLSYRDIATRYLGPKGAGQGGFEARFDAQTQSWSLFNSGLGAWIGYDDPRAVRAKGRFAMRAGLAGVYAWELSQDNGDLINAMNLGVGRRLAAPVRAP